MAYRGLQECKGKRVKNLVWIQPKLSLFNLERPTRRVDKKFIETGEVTNTPGRGRKKILNESDVEELADWIEENPFSALSEIVDNSEVNPYNDTDKTIRKNADENSPINFQDALISIKSSIKPTIRIIKTPIIMYWLWVKTPYDRKKTVIRKDIKIFTPPTLGITPSCDVLLLGFTTKPLFLATSKTTGIKPKPIIKEKATVRYGNLCI